MTKQLQVFTIRPRQWFAWQMLPGYVGGTEFVPYYSPIYVQRITPMRSGMGSLKLAFINAMYAAGVQEFELQLLVLKRAGTYLITEIEDGDDRTAIIGEISFEWLNDVLPGWMQRHPPDRAEEPCKSDVQLYLDARLRPERTNTTCKIF
jgi:hypothetical protein